MDALQAARWLPAWSPRREARVCVYALPPAGGGASLFAALRRELPAWIDLAPVQYPGREQRLGEPPVESLAQLVAALRELLPGAHQAPAVLFGHSFGGIVAYETARLWPAGAARPPLGLIAAGSPPPHLPRTEPPLSHLPDDELLQEVAERYQGIPPAILQQPELLKLILPPLRADLQCWDRYTHDAHGPRLNVPLAAICGTSDPVVSCEQMQHWRDLTAQSCTYRTCAAGHFFPRTQAADTAALVAEICTLWLAESAGPPV